jgi:hypothetical protein
MKSVAKLMLTASAVLGLTGNASAYTFVCTLSASSPQCILNWDASALGSNLDASFVSAAANANSGTLKYEWFDGLNAGGLAGPSGSGTGLGGVLFSQSPASTSPLFDDGRVSLKMTWTSGLFELAFADLRFTDSTGHSLTPTATPGAATVPVAPTLTLVLAGIGAMAAVRRRSR